MCNCGDCCDRGAHEDGWNYDCGYLCAQQGCDDYEDTAITTVAVCTARRSSAEHLIATAWILTAAESFAKF